MVVSKVILIFVAKANNSIRLMYNFIVFQYKSVHKTWKQELRLKLINAVKNYI